MISAQKRRSIQAVSYENIRRCHGVNGKDRRSDAASDKTSRFIKGNIKSNLLHQALSPSMKISYGACNLAFLAAQ
jgi:hypothetical protein